MPPIQYIHVHAVTAPTRACSVVYDMALVLAENFETAAFRKQNKENTAYDRVHENGPYGKITTKKEPITTLGFRTSRLPSYIIINNYSPKWRWIVVDIYRAAKRRGKYPPVSPTLR